ncbi:sensor histidine kinase [Nocardiopsis metallicus]|uniref:histidine kinase n=1 Tax=Nocardiopsis metallicus TaxID=179819 RepID=A0A840W8U7_9ACTN|nr:ATP-binding protein [Nocardiopsis metallicus]MBB5493480.1 signal transduction histidine kinase [Nocardiopsis metallicus]
MSDSPPSEAAAHQNNRQTSTPNSHSRWSTRTLVLAASALPSLLMAALGTVTILFVLAIDLSGTADRNTVLAFALTTAAVGALLILFLAVYGAGQTASRVNERVNGLRTWLTRGQDRLRELTDEVKRGERPEPPEPPAGPPKGGDAFEHLAHELSVAQHASETAVVEATSSRPDRPSAQQVEVFVNVARRMQSLVHREITLLDELEAQVEDPDLLKGLFTIDHLATRMRRQSESLAVLGGAASRRKWSKPVSLYEVLRSAVAEVEHYSRVKVVPPVTGTLNGGAVVDVIHLVAELIENATKFSPPQAQVMLRAEHVPAGVAIDIEDRGLGMQPTDVHRMNSLLADPEQIDIGELLHDGRIGLYVVSVLARKHSVRVQLQRNIYGGTQAVVLLPIGLVGSENEGRGSRSLARSSAETAAAPTAHPTPRPPSAPAPVSVPSDHGNNGQETRLPTRRTADPRTGPAPQPLPVRSAQTQSGGRGFQEPPPAPALASEAGPASQRRPPSGERPPLPERQAQTHLAPELRSDRSDGRHDRGGDHTPDLMSVFQSGFRRAEAENDQDRLDRDDSTS